MHNAVLLCMGFGAINSHCYMAILKCGDAYRSEKWVFTGSDNGLSPKGNKKQCWFNDNWAVSNRLQYNLVQNANTFLKNIVVCKIWTILVRPQFAILQINDEWHVYYRSHYLERKIWAISSPTKGSGRYMQLYRWQNFEIITSNQNCHAFFVPNLNKL